MEYPNFDENMNREKSAAEAVPGQNGLASVQEQEKALVNITDEEALKRKYGKVFYIAVRVDDDDENDGRKIGFYFREPTHTSFNRYMKTASKNMVQSTLNFVMDNVIDEQKKNLEEEGKNYPGLPLNLGQKLMAAIGMGDDVNFRRL